VDRKTEGCLRIKILGQLFYLPETRQRPIEES